MPGFLDDVCDGESALLPLTGEAIAVEDADVKSVENSGSQCVPWVLDDVCDGKSALSPPTGEATTMEEAEGWKEAAHLELTEPLREASMRPRGCS